jgi:PiT family inorganic phosphate transporter
MFPVDIVLALVFGVVNGVHDAGNAIAVPIVTRAMQPRRAVLLASVCHFIGALAIGTAVATTVAGIVSVPSGEILEVLGAALVGALAWNVLTLSLGLPCSSGHCLVGALAGAALADRGTGAVHWGGLQGIRPVGVIGSLLWLVLSTLLAVPLAYAGVAAATRGLRRATRDVVHPIRLGEVLTSATLALVHGSNDAQKTMGLLALALVGGHELSSVAIPFWVQLAAAAAITLGTSLGGWRVVRTLGRGIYRLRALDGLVAQGTASVVVLAASLLGAPVSTTDVIAPAIVGVGVGQRWHHVRWRVVRQIALAWLVTLPASAALAALALPLWRSVS